MKKQSQIVKIIQRQRESYQLTIAVTCDGEIRSVLIVEKGEDERLGPFKTLDPQIPSVAIVAVALAERQNYSDYDYSERDELN